MAPLDVSMTDGELAEFLAGARTARVASVAPDGWPHAIPLWFVWHQGTLHVNTTRGNRTVRNLEADPRAAITIDDGERYDELRGAVLRGRMAEASGDMDAVTEAFGAKYFGGNRPHFTQWRNRFFLAMEPEHISSWDFRKIPAALAQRQAERDRGA
jgi:nitroimidazol reductase NimA-like FMN-containing flavoprotein (pyridoxamine 5'-phosphate oxidase superfamily)